MQSLFKQARERHLAATKKNVYFCTEIPEEMMRHRYFAGSLELPKWNSGWES
ncbi:hypothetical protein TFUB22_00404 [Tannerella forsythia]|uniref:Uncharacterized protein n=1 Tax=Tannerella forsythia TaxID=28112 RepID=A0A1D3UF61_TANFO|nr:hypothetical protein TFUB20_00441 [Tannerella forsythia]SCQ18780.1 hypothetical protein TFUB22_00404 [Tannerella forsythia]